MRLVIAALLAFAGTPAAAQLVATPAPSLAPGEVLLEVEATGETRSRPDVMELQAGVVTTGATAIAALNDNAQRMNRVIDIIKARGVAPRDVRTSELGVRPMFAQQTPAEDQDDLPPRIVGYVARNTLEVQLRDLANVPQLIDGMFIAGVNSVNGPSFSLSDSSQALRSARQTAVKRAMEQAETYASALNMRVARVLRVSQRSSRSGQSNGDIIVTGSRIRPTPIEPGEVTTSSNIHVDFALIPN